MKKILFSGLMALFCLTATAQNIQLHYDFGRHIYSSEEGERANATLTYELFKADKLGSWFYFVDMDFSKHFIESAYTEVAREFNLGKESPFAAHIEYNGGLSRFGSFQHVGLVGAAYNGHTEDFSKVWSVQLMYKQFFKSDANTNNFPSFQLTGVWGLNFLKDKLTFAGFIDLWIEEKSDDKYKFIVMSEPQLWYNFTEHFSLGTEIEFSNNFVYNQKNDKTFFVNPTLAVKWTF